MKDYEFRYSPGYGGVITEVKTPWQSRWEHVTLFSTEEVARKAIHIWQQLLKEMQHGTEQG